MGQVLLGSWGQQPQTRPSLPSSELSGAPLPQCREILGGSHSLVGFQADLKVSIRQTREGAGMGSDAGLGGGGSASRLVGPWPHFSPKGTVTEVGGTGEVVWLGLAGCGQEGLSAGLWGLRFGPAQLSPQRVAHFCFTRVSSGGSRLLLCGCPRARESEDGGGNEDVLPGDAHRGWTRG